VYPSTDDVSKITELLETREEITNKAKHMNEPQNHKESRFANAFSGN
jgi:hypothetical protein